MVQSDLQGVSRFTVQSPTIVFHVSAHDLEPGKIVEYEEYSEWGKTCLRPISDASFHRGLTSSYYSVIPPSGYGFISSKDWDEVQFRGIQFVEYIFERIRTEKFEHCPSRQKALFACENLQDADNFRNNYDRQQCAIYKAQVQPGSVCFRADMKWLDAASRSIEEITQAAVKYWRQEPTGDPFWELLVVGKTKIQSKVT